MGDQKTVHIGEVAVECTQRRFQRSSGFADRPARIDQHESVTVADR